MLSGLEVIGGLTILYYLNRIISFIRLHFFQQSGLNQYLPDSSSSSSSTTGTRPWALITGASDGIGKAFAQELVTSGFNVILHGRNPTKLADVKKSLEELSPQASIKTAVLSAHRFTEEGIDSLAKSVASTPITILVNNVGGPPGNGAFSKLAENSHDDIDAWIGLNVAFPVQLTRALLPQIKEPGLIINMSSGAARLPSPYLSVYSGCKAFNTRWSTSLDAELGAEKRNIKVLSLTIGETANKDFTTTTAVRVSAQSLARSTLQKVGCSDRELIPHLVHASLMAVTSIVPDWIRDHFMLKTMQEMMQEQIKKS